MDEAAGGTGQPNEDGAARRSTATARDREVGAGEPAQASRPEPGEPRRMLERAPAERYRAADEQRAARASGESPSRSAQAGRGVLAALGGAAVMTLLGGPLSVTLGLVVVAAFTGWLVASLVRPDVWLAVGLAVGSVVLGLVGIWLFAGLEGGALGLLDYLAQVQGPLALAHVAAAALMAFGTIR